MKMREQAVLDKFSDVRTVEFLLASLLDYRTTFSAALGRLAVGRYLSAA